MTTTVYQDSFVSTHAHPRGWGIMDSYAIAYPATSFLQLYRTYRMTTPRGLIALKLLHYYRVIKIAVQSFWNS